MACASVWYYPFEALDTVKSVCFTLYTQDGLRWFQSNILEIDESTWGAQEPTLCELSSGVILMSIRNMLGYQFFSVSEDGGQLSNFMY